MAAAAAPSPLTSSVEKTNGAKLSRLLIDGGTTVLRNVFDGYYPPANLAAGLSANYLTLNALKTRRVLHQPQWDLLFPPSGATPDSKTFDITLLFLLLTNICGLFPPISGWHKPPPSSDTSLEANLTRIKLYRNELYGHVTSTGVQTAVFNVKWQEISKVLVALGLNPAEVVRLKSAPCGKDYISAVIEWVKSDEEIKSQLGELRKGQEEARQMQEEDHSTLKDIRVAVEEHFETLQAVNQAFNSLNEKMDARREDQVLQNLVKSEFTGDIEYLVERYQDGTREWVFNEVENWLDNRSSQNRAMVVSANAGMGKSVISAVICKRMQEVGRLSGSHFCQHNNARYRNPQLMLQSLACHLCHGLPEYKEALVKQLSRNPGKDLNNMDVEELFALLFKEPLSTVADPGRNMLIVIDGLDESDYKERNELLDVLANHLSKLPCWIRFLCTTRPERNISEALKHLKPFQLESNDAKNEEDIKCFIENRTQHLIKPEEKSAIVEKLVEKSEGLMLYAYFLVLFIEENKSVLDQENLDDSLPLAISSAYHSYFKRLENELKKELDVNEENFLNLLSAVIASREPMPIDFVSKLLVPNASSPLARRKVLKAISSVSSLLPIRDGCLHIIHKSVKDWLTDDSLYGEHDFIMDEKEGHRILASLCARELVDLKQKGVLHRQFTPTEKYALHHGVRHMLLIDEEMKSHSLNECVKAYVLDLELLYAKLCLNDSAAAEDILWLQKQKMFPMLSEDSQDVLHILLLLLRKNFVTFSDHPHVFFQTVLNVGGSVLSPMASDLLQNKYPEIPYMELVQKQKQMQQGAVLARFQCSSPVACFDVSPELDYMVCECGDGTIYMWSLHTGKLVWTRPAMVKKLHFGNGAYRMSPSSPGVLSFYRSVVFHPTKEVVLPGVLSRAYDFKGEVKPLFPGSSCSFTVCSISGDKTTMLTDCPDNPKCIIMWSLRNGSEIIRTTRENDVLSFAWSRDGKMLAISHCMGSVCLVDVTYGFRTLAETALPDSCGMIKFAPNCQSVFCFGGTHLLNHLVCLNINMAEHPSCSLDVCIKSYVPRKFESRSEAGFLLGDPLSSVDVEFDFLLNNKIVLKGSPNDIFIDMLNIDEEKKNSNAELMGRKEIVFSLSGNTIYNVFCDEVRAFDVSSGELIGQVALSGLYLSVLAVEEGLLLLTLTTTTTIELWNVELSRCVRNWTNLNGIRKLIRISERRVACEADSQVLILDTTSGDIVSTIPIGQRSFLSCNSKCHLVTFGRFSLELWDGETLLWENRLPVYFISQAIFSPGERFLLVSTKHSKTGKGKVFVLDAVSGTLVNAFTEAKVRKLNFCEFISEEECVISSKAAFEDLLLFNVQSGDLLSVIDLESPVTCFATCPRKQLVAINKSDSKHGFKLIQAQLPRSLGNRKSKR